MPASSECCPCRNSLKCFFGPSITPFVLIDVPGLVRILATLLNVLASQQEGEKLTWQGTPAQRITRCSPLEGASRSSLGAVRFSQSAHHVRLNWTSWLAQQKYGGSVT